MRNRSGFLSPLLFCLVLQTAVSAQNDEREKTRELVSRIREIADKNEVEKHWETLVQYIDEGPGYRVREEAAFALKDKPINGLEPKLREIIADLKKPFQARYSAARALALAFPKVDPTAFDSILEDGEFGALIFIEFAKAILFTEEQVRRICAAHGTDNRLASFVGWQLKTQVGGEGKEETIGYLRQILYKMAREAGSEPANLKARIASALSENGMPGAVELAMEALRDELHRMESKGYMLQPDALARIVEKETKKTFGIKFGMEQAEANVGRIKEALKWWDENKKSLEERFRLPK